MTAETPPFPEGKFRTILADPPWPYKQRLGRGKGEGNTTRGGLPYAPMSLAEISGLPVADLADQDCLIALWATNSHLHEGFHTLEAWGFAYKVTATWFKPHFGLGYILRGQTEQLLLGVTGKPKRLRTGPHGATGKSWSTVIRAPRGEHSQKPAIVYAMLEDIGEPPRLELFARRRRQGWASWGLEAQGPAQAPLP